jgi:hypothetical protein
LRQRSFSRRAQTSAAREGGLAYGFSADYSGGTAADSHGLPRYPCLQIKIRVYAARAKVSMRVRRVCEAIQRFFQFGLRFSTSARRPSCESSRR